MLELRILTGLHRGAAVPLDGDIIHVGQGPDNDIVLRDPGMPVHAASFTRQGEATWQYRSCDLIRRGSGSANGGEGKAPVVAGARWFAGPVLIGCEEKGTPWPTAPVPASAPTSGTLPAPRPVLPRIAARTAAAVAAIAGAGLLTLIGIRSGRPAPTRPAPTASAATIAAEPALAPLRVIKGAVYPIETSERPPFGIRSATGGPYGFVVTDNGQVLIPGSRWQAFTLLRIEQRRAVFAGPHPAEVTW